MIDVHDFTDIEHRFDPRFHRDIVVPRAYAYIRDAFESAPKAKGIENIVDGVPNNAVKVITSLHNSHLDYVLIPYVLEQRGERPPVVAAGDNLFKTFSTFDFDKWIRKSGGFKIYREPTRVQLRQLKNYYAHLIRNNETILLFAQARRSYTGEAVPFVKAAISLLSKAAAEENRPIAWIPAANTYERIPEDRFFKYFQAYKDNPTKFNKARYYALDWPMIFAQKFFGHPLGKAIVSFGEPIVTDPPINGALGDKDRLSDLLRERSSKLVELTPTSLVSQVCATSPRIDRGSLLGHIELNLEEHRNAGVPDSMVRDMKPIDIFYRAMRFLGAPSRHFIGHFNNDVTVRRPDVIGLYANLIKHYSTGLIPADKSFLTA